MFLRLTCHLLSDWLTSPTVFGMPAAPWRFSQRADHIGFEFDPHRLASPGAFPDQQLVRLDGSGECAPERPVFSVTWSAPTSVDIAGWTQVVIQEGRHVLSDVNTGLLAVVNGSINWVLGGVLKSTHWLDNYGTETLGDNTCGCPSRSDLNDYRFSCLSFNEVTK